MSCYQIHELKCWPNYFNSARNRSKPFELRLDDRGFNVDDFIVLKEWIPETKTYTGETESLLVTYVMRLKRYEDVKGWRWRLARWLMPDLVILGVKQAKGDYNG
jgi:hypothetical protein